MPPSTSRERWLAPAPVFAALGDATRLQVLGRLWEKGPLSITELTNGSDVSRQAVTKHLRVLAEAGLVRGARDGRESVWKLERKGLQQARRWLDKISEEWDERLERLRTFVEE